MIIPSIDLMEGRAVQLVQGKKKLLEVENPIKLAVEFKKFGRISLIDLDAAFGKGDNIMLIKKICGIAPCVVGGGIRNVKRAKMLIKSGAKKVIIGSMAFEDNSINEEFLEKLKKGIGKERIIIAIDSRNGKIVTGGWKKKTNIKTEAAVKKLEPYCSEFLFTCVEKEGLMKGTNLGMLKKLKKLTKNKINAAGGISSLKEIKQLGALGINSVLGMALYTGKLKIEELNKIAKF